MLIVGLKLKPFTASSHGRKLLHPPFSNSNYSYGNCLLSVCYPASAFASAKFPKTRKSCRAVQCKEKPAREIVVDFGQYAGTKLGSLPIEYLTWMKRSRFRDWAKLAHKVLEDPVYRKSLEVEAHSQSQQLFSTQDSDLADNSKTDKIMNSTTGFSEDGLPSDSQNDKEHSMKVDSELMSRRKLRRQRQQQQQRKRVAQEHEDEDEDVRPRSPRSPFPGRQALFRKPQPPS